MFSVSLCIQSVLAMIVCNHQSLHHIRAFNIDPLQKKNLILLTPPCQQQRYRKQGRCSGVIPQIKIKPVPHSLPFCCLTFSRWTIRWRSCFITYTHNERSDIAMCCASLKLSRKIYDSAMQLQGYTLHHLDRMAEATGKAKRRCFKAYTR